MIRWAKSRISAVSVVAFLMRIGVKGQLAITRKQTDRRTALGSSRLNASPAASPRLDFGVSPN
jgi:hypothetical protein